MATQVISFQEQINTFQRRWRRPWTPCRWGRSTVRGRGGAGTAASGSWRVDRGQIHQHLAHIYTQYDLCGMPWNFWQRCPTFRWKEIGAPSLWWTGQFMAKEKSNGGQSEFKRRLYPWFRHSLSLASQCPPSSHPLPSVWPLSLDRPPIIHRHG